jgi:predicted nucleic acid-binding protein
MSLKIFVDSDVIISSLISQTGASHLLINNTKNLKLVVSDRSVIEIETVIKRLNLDKSRFKSLLKEQFSVINLRSSLEDLKIEFENYVLDPNDAHIVAGAKLAKVQFLISYNIRHFKAVKLKDDFNIILATPANLLQYLRSLK